MHCHVDIGMMACVNQNISYLISDAVYLSATYMYGSLSFSVGLLVKVGLHVNTCTVCLTNMIVLQLFELKRIYKNRFTEKI